MKAVGIIQKQLHFANSVSYSPAKMKNLKAVFILVSSPQFKISATEYFLSVTFTVFTSRSPSFSFQDQKYHFCVFSFSRLFLSPPTPRFVWANDRHHEPGEPFVSADFRRGQAACFYSWNRSCVLDHPDGLQYLVVQTQKEEEWLVQQLCRHTQR